MTQTTLHPEARATGSGQRIFDVLARILMHPAATGRSSSQKRSGGLLPAEILRDTGASPAHQDYSGNGETGSAERLFGITDRIRLGLPPR